MSSYVAVVVDDDDDDDVELPGMLLLPLLLLLLLLLLFCSKLVSLAVVELPGTACCVIRRLLPPRFKLALVFPSPRRKKKLPWALPSRTKTNPTKSEEKVNATIAPI